MSANTLSVELLQDVAHLGRKGEIIEVSSSQARNFLIPKKIAKEVTKDRIQKLENDKKRAQDQARMRLEKAFELQKLLDGQKIEFTLKGKNGKIFGGLAEHEILSRINEKFGVHFEKQDIKLPNKAHIKTVGDHLVYIHITRDTHAKIIVHVSLEN
jgi:large subunit ribosomal protein L9